MIRSTTPYPPGTERRRLRIEDTLLALSCLLERARQSQSLQVVVLADECGLVVAGAGSHRACEEMAAVAAVEQALAANDTTPSRLEVLEAATRVRRVRVDGIELLLVARTTQRAANPCLDDAVSGAVRILSRRFGRSMRCAPHS